MCSKVAYCFLVGVVAMSAMPSVLGQEGIDPRRDLARAIVQFGGQAMEHHGLFRDPQLLAQGHDLVGNRPAGQHQRWPRRVGAGGNERFGRRRLSILRPGPPAQTCLAATAAAGGGVAH